MGALRVDGHRGGATRGRNGATELQPAGGRKGKARGVAGPRGGMGMLRLVSVFLLCLVVAVFAVQNDRPVRLVFWWLIARGVNLAVLVFAAVLLGALAVLAFGLPEVRRLRRRLAALTVELEQLRDAQASAAPSPPPPFPPPSFPPSGGDVP